MYKFTMIVALLFAFTVNAQTKAPTATAKKPAGKLDKKALARQDSLRKDSLANIKPEEPVKLPREFMVYSKKSRPKIERAKLCINLVSHDTVLNYCMNDSLCRDPEVSKILFEQQKGDTLYVLILIDAFTKVDATNDDGRCTSGKETKLVFAKWNTKTNQAKWKQKNISSCLRGTTNMTREPIADWDKASVLTVSYHRGLNFYELKFDPAHYELGLQSNNNSDSEAK